MNQITTSQMTHSINLKLPAPLWVWEVGQLLWLAGKPALEAFGINKYKPLFLVEKWQLNLSFLSWITSFRYNFCISSHCIVKVTVCTRLASWICTAIYNSEVLHALSDHYALNYHSVFSPTAYHAAVALIREHTWGSPTHFTFSTHLAGNELDGLDSIRHISCLRSFGGWPWWMPLWCFVLICDSTIVAMVERLALLNC